jgi:PAS domain S-box-containing protein
MHPLLQRQLARAFVDHVPADVAGLLPLVDAAYREADDDRAMFQRSLDVMSTELQERFDALSHQLQERERHLRILQAVHDAVLVLDDTAGVLEVNEATSQLTGKEHASLVGHSLADVVQITGAALTLDLPKVVEGGGTLAEDVMVTRPDGAARRCELSVVALDARTHADGKWIAVLRDVTERRALQNQLFQSHKLEAIGQLAAGVAHEINTPGQYVADNLSFLREAFGIMAAELYHDDQPAPEALEFLRTEIPSAIEQSLSGMERIAEIVRGIKTFSHPGTGSLAASDLNQMLRTTVTVARNEWKYVADLELDLATDLPVAWVYADEIQHVFLNLVVNAAQAVAPQAGDGHTKGHIRVSSRLEGDRIEIRVADDGPGVPESIREHIFDPFFTTKPAGMGTGQGLAICHRVVEHHNGRIELEDHDGPGAIFVVRLPWAAPAALAA